jgi:adenylosuccinate synthase
VTGGVEADATRVGGGPFPPELHGEAAEALRAAGNEYGSTTGRPRRCGWFDAVAARYACAVSGADELALTNLDVLRGFSPLRIGVRYRCPDGAVIDRLPAFGLEAVQPQYDELPGFDADLRGIRRWDALPEAARRYVEALEQRVGVPVKMISVGPGREEVIHR